MKGNDIGVYSDIYEVIWFKLGIMIDTIVPCILILVYVVLTLFQGYGDARS